MNDYILAIDQGTTSSRAILFDRLGQIVGQHRRPHTQIFPNPGWVSHNPNEIYFNTIESAKRLLEETNVQPAQIAAIGITNQRETLVAWDKKTGEPVCDAIVWQCRRTDTLCKQMEADGMSDSVRQKTGLLIDPYFSATKIKWILKNVPRAATLLDEGRLLVGTIDCFLIWQLTGGKIHATDYTNASRTMLFNIWDLKWDDELLRYFKIPIDILPEVKPSSGIFGYTKAEIFGVSIPIAGVAGDQHAALFGQTCFKEGDVKNTYGTGCFILKNIGNNPTAAQSKLLTTIAWRLNGKAIYALEGGVFTAGAAIEWLIRQAKLVDNVQEINDICYRTHDTGGVVFVPAFSGLGAPDWDMNARGVLCGMSLATGRDQIVRAVMEAISFQSKDVIDAMESESGLGMSVLRVDGGVSRSDFAMQFQADILGVAVERPKMIETTALGAAYLAGLAVGYFGGTEELAVNRQTDTVFMPDMKDSVREEKYFVWRKAVEKAKGWI